MLEQGQHRAAACAHAIAQLRHRDGAAVRDDLAHQRDRSFVGLFGECDVVADRTMSPFCASARTTSGLAPASFVASDNDGGASGCRLSSSSKGPAAPPSA